MKTSTPIIVSERIIEEAISVCDFLALKSNLSKRNVKDALTKGAVWYSRTGKKLKRIRKAKFILHKDDTVKFYYDPDILAKAPQRPQLIQDLQEYTVWNKPAGLLAQGTKYGDHCSLFRITEKWFIPARKSFLVHRLDREASGLMIIAHSKTAAASLSKLFQENKIEKKYIIEVLGIWDREETGKISEPLDGKKAVTNYKLLGIDQQRETSRLMVTIETGRLHQIRRHFQVTGFPVMGDPRYGRGNKCSSGLQLTAVSLSFTCTVFKKNMKFSAYYPSS